MQQYRYAIKYNDGKYPREVLMLDLQKEILEWKELGESIVVIGDWNEDIRSERLAEFKDRLGLHDVMLERLGDTADQPNTYQRERVYQYTQYYAQGGLWWNRQAIFHLVKE